MGAVFAAKSSALLLTWTREAKIAISNTTVGTYRTLKYI